MEQEVDNPILDKLRNELSNSDVDNLDHFQSPNQSFYQKDGEENIAKWQLDLSEDLDRIYHLLQGHSVGTDSKGNIIYIPPKDDNLRPFNEFGVQQIMNILSFYLNRNTILSNYKDEIINKKVYNFGLEITDLIHNKYHDMMLTVDVEEIIKDITGTTPMRLHDGRYVAKIDKWIDDGALKMKIIYYDDSVMEYVHDIIKNSLAEKIKLYPMIVRALVDVVHSAYLRAYNGGERDSLRKSTTLTQSQAVGQDSYNNFGMQQKRRSWINPLSWTG